MLDFIHRYIPKAKGTTLLVLHGTGGNENDLIPLAAMIYENASILAPRGKVLENGMPRYFRRLAEGVFDIEDLKFRTHELADFVHKASEEYGFELRSVVALGYSNGANIAANMLLLRPEVLSGAILLRAMVPLVPDVVPDLSGKKVFISAGRFDNIIPNAKTKELEKLLQEANADVTMNWEESTHSLTQREIEKARLWMLSAD